MGIKAHFLQDKDQEKFYPYAHADAVFDRNGEKVGDRLDEIDETIENIKNSNIQSDWNESDSSSNAYIKNKPTALPASDVSAWAKASTKPEYSWDEINGKPASFPPSSHNHDNATSTKDGFMSSEDKEKLDGISSGANKTIVDSALSDTSTNPVQNKIINSALNSKVPTSRTVNGKSLSSNITLSATDVNAIPSSQKGSVNGIAELDDTGKVPSSQLPSYVDDVIEGYLSGGKFYKESTHSTQITGETGKIYVDLTNNVNKTYRWSGTSFVEISASLALGETSSTAYRGDRGKIAYDHSQSAHAPSNAERNVIVGIQKNGSDLSPNSSRKVNITVPTKVSELQNDSGFKTTDTNTTYTLTKSGSTIKLSGSDGSETTVSDANTTYSQMKGATSEAAGSTGLVPAPAAGSQAKYLRADGTWQTPPNTTYSNATTSSDGLMSSEDKTKLDGIATGANKYVHPSYTAKSSGLYKVTVDATGHVSAASNVTKSDITALGIPGSDTNTWIALKGATTSAAGTAGYAPAPSAGSANRYLRSDGTWAVPPDTNTTYSNMIGASSDASGKTGLVPAPSAGASNRYLRSDGTWQVPPDTKASLSSLGITATAAEINKLDGVTATKDEINFLDGVTSNIQTQLNGKAASGHTHNYAGSSSSGGAANSVKSSLVVKLNGGSTEGTNMFTFNGSTAKSVNITPSSIGAAAASHNHSASNITSGTLSVARGGTGVTSNPSMLVNLSSTSTANVFATSPRPGVTGTLPISNGGTGATSASAARTALGITPANIGAATSGHIHNAFTGASGSGSGTAGFVPAPASPNMFLCSSGMWVEIATNSDIDDIFGIVDGEWPEIDFE